MKTLVVLAALLAIANAALLVPAASCLVDWDDRVDCGQGSQTNCENAGCCWDPTYNGGPPWCFHDSTYNPQPEPTSGVPVFVMMPLDIIDPSNSSRLDDPDTLRSWLTRLRDAGVDGVMCDAWWGVVEQSPGVYDWSAYQELFSITYSLGLRLNFVMSFHRCGGNVGDDCDIPLPDFVLSVNNVYYRDQHNQETREYISLGADHEALFNGRTPMQMYRGYMESFVKTFHEEMSNGWIEDLEIGPGPTGELRYPAYQLDKWAFPGIGAFQCYDNYMQTMLSEAANAAGRPDWAHAPYNAGSYNDRPENTGFFGTGTDNWDSEYGRFFLDWYFTSLLKHGQEIMLEAADVFANYNVTLSMKVAGIHWHYNTASHAAENTAGYYNVGYRNGYWEIAEMLSKIPHETAFDFTCLEMRNSEQQSDANSNPEALVRQTREDAHGNAIKYRGENALARYDRTAYDQILTQSRFNDGQPIHGFTYLRLTSELVNNSNYYNEFVNFVSRMHAL